MRCSPSSGWFQEFVDLWPLWIEPCTSVFHSQVSNFYLFDPFFFVCWQDGLVPCSTVDLLPCFQLQAWSPHLPTVRRHAGGKGIVSTIVHVYPSNYPNFTFNNWATVNIMVITITTMINVCRRAQQRSVARLWQELMPLWRRSLPLSLGSNWWRWSWSKWWWSCLVIIKMLGDAQSTDDEGRCRLH